VTGFVTTLRIVWRLVAPYFRSEDRWAGWLLLGALVATELSLVAIDVLINHWNARFFNALQDRNWDSFVSELIYYCILAAIFIVLAVYQLYLNQWLQIRWRTWMNKTYMDHWLTGANHYRMQLLGDTADNPDQRIADDIRLFVEKTLEIGVGLLSAVVTLSSFVFILWTLSAQAPFTLFGTEVAVPGYLVWAALLYAVVGTVLTHLVGRPLIGLNFRQQQYEADFRFGLVRVRENSEQIALLEGERAEGARLSDRFRKVITNWHAIMLRQKRLTFLTAGYRQLSVVFPYVVVSPAYFSGAIQLGGLTQTASAFSSVERSLSFFITIYRTLAEWRAVVERLDGFDRAIAEAQVAAYTPPVIEVRTQKGQPGIEIDDLAVRLPAGTPLVAADDVVFGPGDRVLVTGPSGSGKTTLFRAIAGVWPFGSGAVLAPKDAKVMVLPQRPYFPIASLGGAISYPAERVTFSQERLAEVLVAVGLPRMVERLEEEAHWNRLLSLGEQQRLGIARAILHAPDYLFLDEATASLDEDSEAMLYRLLHGRLAGTTIVSIGHRATLQAFHRRRLALVRDGERHRVQELALEPAAQ
jgi:putative ATP-binding cassette transporter